MEAVILIIGLIIGYLLCYFVLRPKINNTNRINTEIQEENNKIVEINEFLTTQKAELTS